jgi:hypothetical protein
MITLQTPDFHEPRPCPNSYRYIPLYTLVYLMIIWSYRRAGTLSANMPRAHSSEPHEKANMTSNNQTLIQQMANQPSLYL